MKSKLKSLLKKVKCILGNKHLETIIQIVVAIATVAAVWTAVIANNISMKTLNEQYRVDFAIETKQVNFSWGNDAEQWKNQYKNSPNFNFNDEDLNPKSIILQVRNLGPGVAKNIMVTFKNNTIREWVNQLNKYSNGMGCNTGISGSGRGNFYLDIDGKIYMSKTKSGDEFIEISYLLPNAEGSFDIALPEMYKVFIEKIIIESHNISKEILTPINITIEYYDVHGNLHIEKGKIEIQFINRIGGQDGVASYRLITYKIQNDK